MSARLDHVVVVVPSLDAGTRAFTAAGFTVLAGGRHDALPTENALVCFADGGYLELMAARDPATREELAALRTSGRWERHLRGVSAVARRFLPRLSGVDGVADWVLRADSLAPPVTRLRALGVAASGPVAMSRERPDGERLEWELLLPEPDHFPFWIADRTPRERRVPTDAAATTHANGALGVRAVRVRAASVPTAALELADALDVRPTIDTRGASVLDFAGWRAEIVAGERTGACGVTLAGCGPLPEGLRAWGLESEER